jgi:hypothetical protein
MRRILIVTTLLLSLGKGTSVLNAQELGVVASIGVAGMQMEDMKYLLKSIMDTYPVEARVISSFPPYTSSSFGVLKRIYPHLKAGARYGFTTSGAKANYSDYSGSLTTNITAVSHRLGGFIVYTPLAWDHLEFSICGRADLNLTRMQVSTTIVALGYSNGADNSYKAITPQGSAFAELMYNFGKFSAGLEAGYLVDLPGKLKGDGGKQLTDPADNHTPLTSDWTGWRAGIKGILWLDRGEN